MKVKWRAIVAVLIVLLVIFTLAVGSSTLSEYMAGKQNSRDTIENNLEVATGEGLESAVIENTEDASDEKPLLEEDEEHEHEHQDIYDSGTLKVEAEGIESFEFRYIYPADAKLEFVEGESPEFLLTQNGKKIRGIFGPAEWYEQYLSAAMGPYIECISEGYVNNMEYYTYEWNELDHYENNACILLRDDLALWITTNDSDIEMVDILGHFIVGDTLKAIGNN